MKQMHLYVLHHTNTHKNNNKLLLVNSKNVINQNQDNKDKSGILVPSKNDINVIIIFLSEISSFSF